ncbi:MAG TPA: glycosyltransferase family 2 protein [Anaerolineales bacterium]|nr:glycosyltransferase family 2 protein [Anaerolineales bacterium]
MIAMTLSVIIPAFNEAKTIQEIIRRVQATGLADEILVIDDGSTDGSRDLLAKLDGQGNIKVIYHERNQGKGKAVRTGIQNAKSDFIIIQDADLEYDPREYANLLRPIQEGIAEVVFGSRFLGAGRRPVLFWNMVANKILTLATNILYNNILTDMETGYKLFSRQIVQNMTLRAHGFEFEPEFTAKILKSKARIYEVPITFNPRDYSEGKKIKMRDAFIAMWTLIKYRFVN